MELTAPLCASNWRRAPDRGGPWTSRPLLWYHHVIYTILPRSRPTLQFCFGKTRLSGQGILTGYCSLRAKPFTSAEWCYFYKEKLQVTIFIDFYMTSYTLFSFLKQIMQRDDILGSRVCNKNYGKQFFNKQVALLFFKVCQMFLWKATERREAPAPCSGGASR